MTYELVKQLKDAGFPQKASFYWDEIFEGDPFAKIRPAHAFTLDKEGIPLATDLYAMPTLSELIQACGDGLENLYNDKGGGELKWRTNYVYDDGSEYNDWAGSSDSYGSTPEEAVARLWLELHRDKN